MKTTIKTNTVHFGTLKAITLSLFSAVLLSSLTALAVGGGSGNGNGDDAFALQRLGEANPGLKPHEILIEAFKESNGRPVELTFQSASDEQEYSGLLGDIYKAGYYFANLNKPENEKGLRTGFVILRSKTTDGPLLGGKHERGRLYDYVSNRYIGDVIDNSTSIIIEHIVGDKMEFRQYNSKIIIFVSYPLVNRTTKKSSCRVQNDFPNTGTFTKEVPASGFCSIGYIWKD